MPRVIGVQKSVGRSLNGLLTAYQAGREAIQRRLRDFAAVRRSEYFYELLYCILTPQSSARNADCVIEELKSAGFRDRPFDPEPVLRSREHYIRFHKTKSKHLLKVREEFPSIEMLLHDGLGPRELRDRLVTQVEGLGYKEATHFMRNIGRNGGLAILDRHILRNLKRYGVIRSVPTALTKRRYLCVEQRFVRFAERIGIPLDELDLLFWSIETGEIRK